MDPRNTDYEALQKHLADGLAKAKEALAESETMLKHVKHVRERLEVTDGNLDRLMPEKQFTHAERVRFLGLMKELIDKGELAQLSRKQQAGPSSPHIIGAREEGKQHVIYQ